MDITLTPEDKIVSIFREVSCPIILILDNLDYLLSISPANLTNLFVDFLDSNINITILVTCRELVESMRDQIKGFKDVRIRPLRPVSSVKFVRRRLPLFSQNVITRVGEISFHVPLAIKLIVALIQENSEEMANKVLEELRLSEHRMEHFEKDMQFLFDIPYQKLTSTDKHALISLPVFFSLVINKDAAIEVVSWGTDGASNAIRSLKTLVKTSLIDEDPSGECFSIHPLIYSFIIKKVREGNFEKIMYGSSVFFCRHYVLLFEKLNVDFLAGMSLDTQRVNDIMPNLHSAIMRSAVDHFENSEDLLRVLCKSEILLFLFDIPRDSKDDMLKKVYESAIQKCQLCGDDSTCFKLCVSSYFRNITFSLFVSNVRVRIPNDLCEKINSLSDGTAAKLSCYQGICSICDGDVRIGISQIEMSLNRLQVSSDNHLLKCLCLQVLTQYYNSLSNLDKSREFREMAIEVCNEIGNFKLFLIDNCEFPFSESSTKDVGEPVVVFSYLVTMWSRLFHTDDTKRLISNTVSGIEERLGMQECSSYYLYNIHCYADSVIACLNVKVGEKALFTERIEFLSRSRDELELDCGFQTKDSLLDTFGGWSERLLNMYTLKGTFTNRKDLVIKDCKKALDLSLQHKGEQHKRTAECYFSVGLAERANENYSSALTAFDEAIDIVSGISSLDDDSQFLTKVYIEQGKTHELLRDFKMAIASFEKALQVISSDTNQGSEKFAEVLDLLGWAQCHSMELTSALVTFQRSLDIKLKLFSEKSLPSHSVTFSHLNLVYVYHRLGKHAERQKCFENALHMNTGCESESVLVNCVIYQSLLIFEVASTDLASTEFLTRCFSVLKTSYLEIFPYICLTVAHKQLQSKQYESGVISVKKALDIALDILLDMESERLLNILRLYLLVLDDLVKIGKCELASEVADRALQISKSFAESRQARWIFRFYYWKGRIHIEKQEYIAVIKHLEYATQLIPELSGQDDDKSLELSCQWELSLAYNHEGRFEDALGSLYKVLSIVQKNCPKGSEQEAKLFNMAAQAAQKLKNKKLALNNFRLSYKMYSKVLGENHPSTQISYLTYARALMNLH